MDCGHLASASEFNLGQVGARGSASGGSVLPSIPPFGRKKGGGALPCCHFPLFHLTVRTAAVPAILLLYQVPGTWYIASSSRRGKAEASQSALQSVQTNWCRPAHAFPFKSLLGIQRVRSILSPSTSICCPTYCARKATPAPPTTVDTSIPSTAVLLVSCTWDLIQQTSTWYQPWHNTRYLVYEV